MCQRRLPGTNIMPLADDSSLAGNYTVLARRYRPSRFEDCVGQQHVAQALRNAIETGRVAHAYLFCGSRGVGKTSMARIFAKALNCSEGPTAFPCGQCESCLAITAGSDLDVVEIDGASNRGIDEIRELRQGVSYRPSRSRFKIYIIDEVHMLTKEAFNALLKTLEEPPPHVKFIFATTEAQKIPITILSRCQRYDFAGIGLAQITQRLTEIVQSEGMTAEPEAVDIIARRARGSMRDSQSLLDQVLAYAAGHLTSATVHQLLGTAGEERILALGHAILAGDAASAIAQVQTAVDEGVQLGEWIEQMLDYFRDLMVISVDRSAPILSMSPNLHPTLGEHADRLGTERILEMMDILAACRNRLRGTTFGRTLVEMTFVRLCRLDQLLNVGELLASPASPSTTSAAPRPAPPRSFPPPAGDVGKKNGTHEPLAPRTVLNDPAPQVAPAIRTISLDLSSAMDVWREACQHLTDPILNAIAGQVERVDYEEPAQLILRFPSSAGFSRQRCEDNLEAIRSAVAQVAGRPVNLRCDQLSEDADAARKRQTRSPTQLRMEAAKDPMVKLAEDLLGARICNDVTAVDPSKIPAANPSPETPEEEP
jgi:DNA polymerase-3 subunit gamma/tau